LVATAVLLGGALRSEPAPAALGQRAQAHEFVTLGLELEAQARVSFDSSLYARAEEAFAEASALDPSDPVAVRGLATVALNRHEFRRALGLARRAHSLAPELAATHGTFGDALVELGRYQEAFAAFDRYAALKPGFGAYVRVAYAQELLGRPGDAEATMQLALAAVPTGREPLAWTLTQLGKLRFGTGDVAGAAREYRRALRVLPRYVPAREGLALTEAARGRPRRAIATLAPVVETIPLPQAAATLGELYRSVGDTSEAARQDGLLRVEERLLASRGVRNDLETAALDVDRGVRLRESLASLRRVHCRASEHRRRRRARLGAHAQRPVRRGGALRDAFAAARHARRGETLPPRDGRALPGPDARGAPHVQARARDEPALLAPMVAGRAEVRAMKRVTFFLAVLALLAPAAASAHPLGNFTVNRFAAVDVSGDRLFVRYAADLAEIPTYQIGSSLSASKLAPQLVLRVDGRRSTLRLLGSRIANRPGAGGLPTLRLDAVFEGRAGKRVELLDRTFAGRIGWREVVVRASRGATVTSSSVPAVSVSDELRRYPSNRLRSPLDVTRAVAVVEPGTEHGTPPPLGGRRAGARCRRVRGSSSRTT
jgi:tetratricopeptide (TPR) repeat protein